MVYIQPPRDLFEMLCHQAAGMPIPAPPSIPGRAYVQPMNARQEPDEFAAAWDRRTGDGSTSMTTHSPLLASPPTPTTG